MTENKKALRQHLRQTQEEVDSAEICRRIFEHPWYKAADVIMAFVPKYPEPDITPVLEDVLRSGKTLLLPRCDTKTALSARRIRCLDELQPGIFGLMEPTLSAELFPPERIELILVPGLAFDEEGNRLGQGRGYYDRFLPQTNAKTIGIAGRVISAVPTLSHDQAMDSLITENKTIQWDRRTTYVGREKEKE